MIGLSNHKPSQVLRSFENPARMLLPQQQPSDPQMQQQQKFYIQQQQQQFRLERQQQQLQRERQVHLQNQLQKQQFYVQQQQQQSHHQFQQQQAHQMQLQRQQQPLPSFPSTLTGVSAAGNTTTSLERATESPPVRIGKTGASVGGNRELFGEDIIRRNSVVRTAASLGRTEPPDQTGPAHQTGPVGQTVFAQNNSWEPLQLYEFGQQRQSQLQFTTPPNSMTSTEVFRCASPEHVFRMPERLQGGPTIPETGNRSSASTCTGEVAGRATSPVVKTSKLPRVARIAKQRRQTSASSTVAGRQLKQQPQQGRFPISTSTRSLSVPSPDQQQLSVWDRLYLEPLYKKLKAQQFQEQAHLEARVLAAERARRCTSWSKKWKEYVSRKRNSEEGRERMRQHLELQRIIEDTKECTFQPRRLPRRPCRRSELESFLHVVKQLVKKQQEVLQELHQSEIDLQNGDAQFREKLQQVRQRQRIQQREKKSGRSTGESLSKAARHKLTAVAPAREHTESKLREAMHQQLDLLHTATILDNSYYQVVSLYNGFPIPQDPEYQFDTQLVGRLQNFPWLQKLLTGGDVRVFQRELTKSLKLSLGAQSSGKLDETPVSESKGDIAVAEESRLPEAQNPVPVAGEPAPCRFDTDEAKGTTQCRRNRDTSSSCARCEINAKEDSDAVGNVATSSTVSTNSSRSWAVAPTTESSQGSTASRKNCNTSSSCFMAALAPEPVYPSRETPSRLYGLAGHPPPPFAGRFDPTSHGTLVEAGAFFKPLPLVGRHSSWFSPLKPSVATPWDTRTNLAPRGRA